MNNKAKLSLPDLIGQSIIFLLLLCLISLPIGATEDAFYPAQVSDISDRAYEKALINLLDNAQESITISEHKYNLKEII